jgi:hypothetical protein
MREVRSNRNRHRGRSDEVRESGLARKRLEAAAVAVDPAANISPIPRQLAFPMVVFAIGIKHALDMLVQCFHDTDAREHCRAVPFGHQDQRFHRGLPFLGVMFGLP